MNFVRTHIYKQEITSTGFGEVEQDSKVAGGSSSEKRFRKLPVFDEGYKQQKQPEERKFIPPPQLYGDSELDFSRDTESYTNAISAAVTADDLEFFEEIERRRHEAWKRRKAEEAEFLQETLKLKSKIPDDIKEEKHQSKDSGSTETVPTIFSPQYTSKKTDIPQIKVIPKTTQTPKEEAIIEGYSSEED